MPQDRVEAASWCRKAAEQGDTDAQCYLGLMYDEGHGVPQDRVEAHMWLDLAASRTSVDDQKAYADGREAIARKMTPQQMAVAQRRAREWKPKTWDELKRQDQK